MSKTTQIKTHFDIKVIILFIIIFIFSCILLLYKKKIQSICKVEGFKIESSSLKNGQLITFSDTTSNSYDWKWDFGDGSKESYLSKANHSYENAGSYNVKLLVNNNCLVEKRVKILPNYADEESSLYPKLKSPEFATQNKVVQFKDMTQNATSWEWCFDSSKGFKVDATEKNPTYIYKTPGSKTVSLVVNGDKKHMKTVPILVNKEEIKDDPPPPPLPPTPPKPIVGGLDKELLISSLYGISKNKLEYKSFARFFCKKRMPQVNVNEERTISLKELDEEIRGKKIRIKDKEVTIQKEGDCVIFINLNYK